VNEVILRATFTAEADVTKAADIRQWTVRGVFEDDAATVEVGNQAVYIRTLPARACMLTPQGARELAAALGCAADNAEAKDPS